MPVTISGDATKKIQALAYNLSDDRMRDLTIQLRDSLVKRLAGVQWSGQTSIYIMRGLTAYTEPVRTPTGGWTCGVGSLDILHRDDAPGKTITEFLYWYQTQYMPTEKKRRAAEKAIKAKRPEISPAAKRAQYLKSRYRESLRLRAAIRVADLRDVDLRMRLEALRAKRNEAVRQGRDRQVVATDIQLRRLDTQLAENLRRMREAEAHLAELRARR